MWKESQNFFHVKGSPENLGRVSFGKRLVTNCCVSQLGVNGCVIRFRYVLIGDLY